MQDREAICVDGVRGERPDQTLCDRRGRVRVNAQYAASNRWLLGWSVRVRILPGHAKTRRACITSFIQDKMRAWGRRRGPVTRSTTTDDDPTALVRDYYNERRARTTPGWSASIASCSAGAGAECVRVLAGKTLEVAVGTGANLPLYPPDAKLTAIDLSPAMLAVAERRAQELDLDIDLGVGDAQGTRLPRRAVRHGTGNAAFVDGPRSPAGGGRDAASPSAGRSSLDPRFRAEPDRARAMGRASTRAADSSITLLAATRAARLPRSGRLRTRTRRPIPCRESSRRSSPERR